MEAPPLVSAASQYACSERQTLAKALQPGRGLTPSPIRSPSLSSTTSPR